VLVRYNLTSPTADLFGAKGRQWLSEMLSQEQMRVAACKVIRVHLELIDHLDMYIEALESDQGLTKEQAAAVKLLSTIPGVGKIIATTMIAEIGHISRFNSPKALGNWAGLTPRVHSSGEITRHGRISKEGTPFLRAAMTQAATVASRRSKRWYLGHETLVKRCGRKGAKVAVARRLLTVAYHMLARNEPYQENYPQKPFANRGT
jgi:transposase